MLLLHLTAQSRSLRGEEQEVTDTAGCSVLAKQVIGFLTEDYARDLSLEDVAAGVGITKHYLCNARRSPGTFMYSVLATKSITPDMINEFERRKKKRKSKTNPRPCSKLLREGCGHAKTVETRKFQRF